MSVVSLWKKSYGVTIQNSLKDIKGKVKAHTSQMLKQPELIPVSLARGS